MSGIVSIIGSADNAWKRGNVTNLHHLVFTNSAILVFDVLSKKKIQKEARQYLRPDPLTRVPFGPASPYAMAHDSMAIHQQLAEEAIGGRPR
ncbi:MAG: hypothetical protein QXV22_03965 [Thermoplasmataceae archaeon]